MFDKAPQRSSGRYWPQKDIKLLKRHYGKTPLAEIAAQLARTQSAVSAKAYRLGLRLPPRPNVASKTHTPRNHRSRWTITELNYVEAHYGKISTRKIAAKLGRGVSAIRMAAQSLGVCKEQAQAWSEEEIAVLRTHYAEGVGITYVQAHLPGRAKKSIFAKACELGIDSAHYWHPDEEQILRECYAQMGTKVGKKLPRRSADAIKIKASLLGLRYHTLKDISVSFKPWSEAEWRLLERTLNVPYSELMPQFPQRSKRALEKARERLRKRLKSRT